MAKKEETPVTWELIERTKSGESTKRGEEILGNWHVKRAVPDIQDAAEKMIKLQDENLRKEYGKNGRRTVLNEYSWEVIGNQWNELIKRI